jgi:hypothetical protein
VQLSNHALCIGLHHSNLFVRFRPRLILETLFRTTCYEGLLPVTPVGMEDAFLFGKGLRRSRTMKAAFACRENRIAPGFDTARRNPCALPIRKILQHIGWRIGPLKLPGFAAALPRVLTRPVSGLRTAVRRPQMRFASSLAREILADEILVRKQPIREGMP